MWGWVAAAVVACAASSACLRASRLAAPRGARAWRLQAAAVLAWAGYAGLRALAAPEQLAALAWLAYAVPVAAAMWLTSLAVDPRSRTRMLLDGTTAATVTLVVLWTAGFGAAWSAAGPGREEVGLLLRPAVALGLGVFFALVTTSEMRPGRRLMPTLLIGSVVATAVAESARSWAVLGGAASPVVMGLGLVLTPSLVLAAACIYRGTSVRDTRPPTSRQLVTHAPYLLLLPAGGALLQQGLAGRGLDAVQGWAVAVLVLVVLLRQGVTAAENRDLVHRLSTSEQQLRHQATHDPLTGLANRYVLTERLAKAVAGGLPTGLLVVDLDGFKAVNDRWGHAVGDLLLQQTADRLRSGVREGDLVVRLGGDEFAVVVRDHDALLVAERLRGLLEEPFDLDGRTVRGVSASIGVAFCRPAGCGTDPARAVEQLVRRADAAMYVAKRAGAGGVAVEARDPAGEDGATVPA